MRLLDGLEVTAREKRLKVTRAILYVAQGTFREGGGGGAVLDAPQCLPAPGGGHVPCAGAAAYHGNRQQRRLRRVVRKLAVSPADSTDLRVLFNIMHLIVETAHQACEGDKAKWRTVRQTFRAELGSPLYNKEPFAIVLFGLDPYKADDSREEEEENDDDNSLEGETFPFERNKGNDLDAPPWDFQAEECALRANIKRFNARRYDPAHSNPDFLSVYNCLQSVLGQWVDLPEDFQMNYDLWLEREVFSKRISWEELLQ
uniref:Uncharacterized protein n=1 Tax=Myotis myotis TaxID=51298 RepID=A0A7J7YDS6_MYOMY|nr:hypothetical protein mMyoMyo1_011070 [Myotis myotis]